MSIPVKILKEVVDLCALMSWYIIEMFVMMILWLNPFLVDRSSYCLALNYARPILGIVGDLN